MVAIVYKCGVLFVMVKKFIMNIFKKFYPFLLGLLIVIILIGKASTYGFWSITVLFAYFIGYFKLTKFHIDEK